MGPASAAWMHIQQPKVEIGQGCGAVQRRETRATYK